LPLPERSRANERSSRGWAAYLLAFFLLVYTLLLTRELGYKSLVWDEAVIAQSGVDLVRLLPSLLSDPQETIDTYVRWFPYFPPLMSVVLSAAYSIFGVSEFVARSVSVSFSLLALTTTFLLGREAFEESTGVVSALLLSAMPIYWHMSRVAMLDVASVFFFALTLYLYYRGLKTDRRVLILLSGLPLGLGILTKYSNILCVPVLLIAFILESSGREGVDWRSLASLLLALEMAFFIFIPWFYKTTMVSQSWRRWVHEIRPGTGYKWLLAEYWIGSLTVPLLQMTPPLTALVVVALIYSLRERSRTDLFLLGWVATVFIWFVPIHKDLRYTMPYLPALAILSGRLLRDASGKALRLVSCRIKEDGGERSRFATALTLILALLIVSPILHGLASRPRDLRVPIQEAFVYVVENIEVDRNILILLTCNNFSQHASYFYMYMAAGLEASIHILKYPSNSVDWYDPGPVNMRRIDQICMENRVQYVLLWDGSPYSGDWLPALLDSSLLTLQKVVGLKGNAIYIFEFQSG